MGSRAFQFRYIHCFVVVFLWVLIVFCFFVCFGFLFLFFCFLLFFFFWGGSFKLLETVVKQGWATSGFNLNSGFFGVENIVFSSAIVAQ